MLKDKLLAPVTLLSKSQSQKEAQKEKNYTQLCDISSILSSETTKQQSTSKKEQQHNMKNFSQKNILCNAIKIISESGVSLENILSIIHSIDIFFILNTLFI